MSPGGSLVITLFPAAVLSNGTELPSTEFSTRAPVEALFMLSQWKVSKASGLFRVEVSEASADLAGPLHASISIQHHESFAV
jgi:hypothetical protein